MPVVGDVGKAVQLAVLYDVCIDYEFRTLRLDNLRLVGGFEATKI